MVLPATDDEIGKRMLDLTLAIERAQDMLPIAACLTGGFAVATFFLILVVDTAWAYATGVAFLFSAMAWWRAKETLEHSQRELAYWDADLAKRRHPKGR